MLMLFRFSIILFSLITLTSCGNSQFLSKRNEAIFDGEMDANDLYSLYLFSRCDEAKLLGVTIAGTAIHNFENAPENAESVLYLANRPEVPVSSKLAPNFCGQEVLFKDWRDLVKDTKKLGLPPSPIKPLDISGPELIHRILTHTEGKVTLLALGPLNNIAHAISEHPLVAKKIERIIMQGGALNIAQSSSIPHNFRWKQQANYNFSIDACAANIIFTSGIPVTLVPIDITYSIPIDQLVLDRYLKPLRTPGQKFVVNVLENIIRLKKENSIAPFWNMACIMNLTHPKIFKTEQMKVKVITEKGELYGSVEESRDGTLIDVCTYIDPNKFYETFFNMINRNE